MTQKSSAPLASMSEWLSFHFAHLKDDLRTGTSNGFAAHGSVATSGGHGGGGGSCSVLLSHFHLRRRPGGHLDPAPSGAGPRRGGCQLLPVSKQRGRKWVEREVWKPVPDAGDTFPGMTLALPPPAPPPAPQCRDSVPTLLTTPVRPYCALRGRDGGFPQEVTVPESPRHRSVENGAVARSVCALPP